MSKTARSHSGFPDAIAGVEASDIEYRNGQPSVARRRRLELRIRRSGLWLIVALSLAPGLWPAASIVARAALKWLPAILG